MVVPETVAPHPHEVPLEDEHVVVHPYAMASMVGLVLLLPRYPWGVGIGVVVGVMCVSLVRWGTRVVVEPHPCGVQMAACFQ